MKKKHLIIVILVTIVMISVVCFLTLKAKKANNKKIETYTTNSSQKVFIDGKISPEESKDFYLDSSKGKVDKINVSDGQTVKEGDILFTYKNEQISTQIGEIENKIKNAKVQVNQTQQSQLVNNKQIVDTQINELKDQMNSLKEKEYTEIAADFDGKVYVGNSNGQPNVPIVTLKTIKFHVKGKVSEKDQPKIKVGQPVNILIISLKKSVSGKIKFVGENPTQNEVVATPNAAPQGNISYYNVDISCDSQGNLTDGFHVQAVCNLSNDPIKVPNTSILKDGETSFVYKVVNKKLKKQTITVGKSENNSSVIKSGLSENETIVKNATAKLKEGQSIE